MTAAKDAAGDARLNGQQPSLFEQHEAGSAPARLVERAVRASVDAAFAGPDPVLSTVHQGLAASAIVCARAMDVASSRSDPYGVAAAAQRLQEALVTLGLVPKATDDPADEALRELVNGLASPDS